MPSKTPSRRKNQESKASKTALSEKIIREQVNNAISSVFARTYFLEAYSRRLEQNDKQIDGLIQQIFAESNRTHKISKLLYVFSYLVAILTLFAGLYFLFFFSHNSSYSFAGIPIIGGISSLIYLHRNNPTRYIEIWANRLSALSYIYLGYMHQLHPLDTALKRMLLANDEIDSARFEELLQQIQDVTDEAMGKLTQILDKTGG